MSASLSNFADCVATLHEAVLCPDRWPPSVGGVDAPVRKDRRSAASESSAPRGGPCAISGGS